MNIDELLGRLAERALPVDLQTIGREPGPDCLTDAQIDELVRGEGIKKATVQKLADHVLDCERCWALAQLLLRQPHASELSAAGEAIDNAIIQHLSQMPDHERASVADRMITVVLQWLPGPHQPQVVMQGVLADEAEAENITLEVREAEVPLVIRFVTPEGPPSDAQVVMFSQDGTEAFRGKTDADGQLAFSGPTGTYRCSIEGYDGPLLLEGED